MNFIKGGEFGEFITPIDYFYFMKKHKMKISDIQLYVEIKKKENLTS